MAMTILIVDDSATMLMSLKTGLTISGFKVESANCGQAALDKLKSGIKPDLILTDINMPGMTGLELIGKIRALSSFRFTPILTLPPKAKPPNARKASDLVQLDGWSSLSLAMIWSKSSSRFCLERKNMSSVRLAFHFTIFPDQAGLLTVHSKTRENES